MAASTLLVSGGTSGGELVFPVDFSALGGALGAGCSRGAGVGLVGLFALGGISGGSFCALVGLVGGIKGGGL